MNLNSLTAILADAGAPQNFQENPTATSIRTLLFAVFAFVMLYVMMIRPQSRKAKEQAKMLSTVKPGDKVVTSGGVVGTVLTVKEKTVSIRSAETKLEVLKSAISDITERSGESSPSES
jgi:preprotein translocase subunit YajC